MLKSFNKIRLVIGVLLISQTFVGLAIIFVTAAFQYLLASFLIEKESGILSGNYLNSYLIGLHVFVIHLCSMPMWKSIWNRRYSASIHMLLTMWLLFSLVALVCGFITIWFMFFKMDDVIENISTMLYRSIDAYYTNPECKLQWDQLQYRHKCCGVNQYLDWMNASWTQFTNGPTTTTDLNFYNYENYEQQIVDSLYKLRDESLQHNEEYELPPPVTAESFQIKSDLILVPYACCNHNNTECRSSYLHAEKNSDNMSKMNLNDIYTGGCLTLFRHHLLWFINALQILIVTGIIIHILTCALTKFLMFLSWKNINPELDSNYAYCDDDGNILIQVKCPPNIKFIVMEDNICKFDQLDMDKYT